MKKILLSVFTVVLAIATVFAQAPEKMNYQGVARDNSGNVLPNQNVGLQIKLRTGSPGGTVVYQEAHAATTNAFGLFNVQIGGGTVQSGTFASIAWGSNTVYVEVLMDASGGTSYTSMGTQQLVSVPYALNAKAAANVNGTTNYVSKFTSANAIGNSSIFDNGLVGIGTTTPGHQLHIFGSSDPLLQLDGPAGSQSVLGFATAGSNKWAYYVPNGLADLGLWNWQTYNNAIMFDGTNDDVYIAPDAGNVGIGTNAPSYNLTVYEPSSWAVLNLQNSTTGNTTLDGFMIGHDDAAGNNTNVWNWENGYLQFGTNGTQRMIIDNVGKVGIAAAAPVSDLDINQSGGSSTAQQTGGINLQNGQYYWRIYNSNDYVRYNYSNDNGATYTPKAYVSSADGSWNQLSDASLKRDIQPIGSVLSSVLQLNPVTYYYNDNDADDNRSTGFLAQEVQKVFPTFVSHEKGETLLGIDYSKFAVVSIKAIQEQQELINKLEKRIEKLEAK
ncbi:MAG: hypothetical protein POELPBGB_01985 [Bacteroidia bacterium]|nr:hypothetical protein [Bacteroidia bacterium]